MSLVPEELIQKVQAKMAEQNEVIREQQVQIQDQQTKIDELQAQVDSSKTATQDRDNIMSKLAELVE